MNDLAAGWEEAWELTVVVGDVLGGNSLGSFIFSNSPLFDLWFVKGIRRESWRGNSYPFIWYVSFNVGNHVIVHDERLGSFVFILKHNSLPITTPPHGKRLVGLEPLNPVFPFSIQRELPLPRNKQERILVS